MTTKRSARFRAASMLAAGAIAGGVLAATVGASAASGGGTTSSTSPPAGPATPGPPRGMGATPVRSDEKAVTASQEATIRAAALKAVPGGTVYRVETDAGDAAYEAHMTKADGTRVTVKLDKNLTVTAVEDGMGKGDPAPAAGPAGGPGAPPAPSGSTTTG